jgi:long-chain fatty acid transport protein
MSTSMAHAGGIDRLVFGTATLFEPGNYAEFSISRVNPRISGDYPPGLGGGSTGNMAGDYTTLGFSLKQELSDRIALGFFLSTPYGADADYQSGAYTGLAAEWDSRQLALVLKYQVTPNVSVFGGARYVESMADIAIPDALIRGGLAAAAAEGKADAGTLAAVAPPGTLAYTAQTERDGRTGFILGTAYEMPEIALRVALTYESGVTHKLNTTEAIAALPGAFPDSITEIEMPQSVNLEFQTGVAAGTLLFGSVRWSEWSVWEVRPAGYDGLTGDRVTGIDNDVVTYRLGVGRQLNDSLSVFGRVTYERTTGDVSSRLSPIDGQTSIGVGATYNLDNIKITGGIEYAMLGDATDPSGVEFRDNTALGLGLSVGYRY